MRALKSPSIPIAATGALLIAAIATAPSAHASASSAARADDAQSNVVLVVHGGAGGPPVSELDDAREATLRAELKRALEAGHAVLKRGGGALDAVEAAIVILEDSPSFNAGRGAVLTEHGRVELDASLMDGPTRKAGAVTGLLTVQNPVVLARAVLDDGVNVMLAGAGAERFARAKGLARVDPEWFITPQRVEELERAKAKTPDRAQSSAAAKGLTQGTVGAVALDQRGGLAAATSTGGRTNKHEGRIGDSPIIGAGTWADARCAVSATGHGEYFIRVGVAHAICARVALLGEPIGKAADQILGEVAALGGDGGVIVLDANGAVAMPFNTRAMARGTIRDDGTIDIRIDAE